MVDGKDVLTLAKGTIVVSAEGDVLASENFRQFVKEGYHQRTKTFAAAKALVAAKIKENDPSERAKSAGCIVGKTDTVLSLIATYGTDKSLKGKSLEVGGVFVNVTERSDPRMPFGGIRSSGHGRELGCFGIREFVNVKTVWVAGD